MYLPNDFYLSDFNEQSNTYDRNKSRYIGLNRTANKNNNFFFQPNSINAKASNQYKKIHNNPNTFNKNILNKSTDVNCARVVNPSQIKHSMETLGNKIKKLNGLLQNTNQINFPKNKNNSYIINWKKGSNNFNSNYTFLRNNPDPNNLNNYQKLNQTYKINNNINKNYYITYDMKKMKFNFNNNDLNIKSDYSDNEMYKRKFSQSTHSNKNKFKINHFSNKSDFSNTNYGQNNFENAKIYKSTSIYKGIKNNMPNFGFDIQDFNINEDNNNGDEYQNNDINYNVLKNNLLFPSNTKNKNGKTKNNQNAKYNPNKNYINPYIEKSSYINNNNIQNSKLKLEKNVYSDDKYNKNTIDDDNSDLSELADEFIEAFNIDVDNGEIEDNIKRTKSSNIYYKNNYSISNTFENRQRSKEISMNDIKYISNVSPRFNINTKQKDNVKDIKPFNESINLEESLIHDSELDIPLIIQTLINNNVMKKNKSDEISSNPRNNEKVDFNKNIYLDFNKNDNTPIKNDDFIKNHKKDNNFIKDVNDNKNKIDDKIELKQKNESEIINEINLQKSESKKKEDENKEENNSKEIINSDSDKSETNKKEEESKENYKSQVSKPDEKTNNHEDEILVNQYLSKIENDEKSKSKRHISIKLENNIIINFKPEDLITDIKISKPGEEDTFIPFERNFNLYLKILKTKVKPNPSIKNFNKNEIKTNADYKLAEFLEEKDIIPELVEDNEEDIKSLEKSLERSIDKSFDKNYERSLNMSVNQSNNQEINQSYTQSMTQSYMENSFNRNSGKFGTGGGLIQKLNKIFDINEDKSEYEENEEEKDEEANTNKDKDIEEIEENDEEEEKTDEEKNEEKDDEEKNDEKDEEEKNEEEEQEQEQEQENEEENEINEEDEINEEQQENNEHEDNLEEEEGEVENEDKEE